MTDTAQAPTSVWAIFFEDAIVAPLVFIGPNAEKAARKTHESRKLNWNCVLLCDERELAQARADIEERDRDLAAEKMYSSMQFDELSALRERCEGLEKDAARYKYLRDHDWDKEFDKVIACQGDGPLFDEVIDTALAQGGEERG